MRTWSLLPLVLVVASLIAHPGLIAAQETTTAEQAAADAAVALSRLEATGQFDALYDRMHPDAQAIIPRAAVVGWYANEFAPLGPGVITVTGVRFTDWTWGVTGVTYVDAAEVSFVQPFADGSTLQDAVRLVQDDAGEWRWFFGRNRSFVDEQIARYAALPEGTEGVLVAIVSVDDVSEQRLVGACYVINGASLEGCDENGDGQVDFQGVAPGTYSVTQTRAPTGYLRIEDFFVTIPADQPSAFSVPHQAIDPGDSPQSGDTQESGVGLLPGAPTIAADADLRCEEFVTDWSVINGIPALTSDGIVIFSGCWQDANGRWFLPTGPDDPRLPGGSLLSMTDREQTSALRLTIVAQLTQLNATMETIPLQVLVDEPDGTLKDAIYMLYDPVKRPVVGHTSLDMAGSPMARYFLDDYLAVFVPAISAPNNQALRSYASWWGHGRQTEYPDAALAQLSSLSRQWRVSELDPIGIDRPPFPWDLADPMTLDLYLRWALDNGYVDAATTRA